VRAYLRPNFAADNCRLEFQAAVVVHGKNDPRVAVERGGTIVAGYEPRRRSLVPAGTRCRSRLPQEAEPGAYYRTFAPFICSLIRSVLDRGSPPAKTFRTKTRAGSGDAHCGARGTAKCGVAMEIRAKCALRHGFPSGDHPDSVTT